ncbi:MAG: PLDc_N domain-containing protein [Rhodobacteraceae bacterium]|nr:PLDc_N domain-containing protein [Paracoccaceae bacterium]
MCDRKGLPLGRSCESFGQDRAKPDFRQQRQDETTNANYSGFLGILHLALVIWAAVSILGARVSTGRKVLWILLVLIFPVVGLIIWFLAGPRGR